MADYFHLTEREAASHFDVCLTSFKKICRARGLSRWPHRKARPVQFDRALSHFVRLRVPFRPWFLSTTDPSLSTHSRSYFRMLHTTA